MVACPRVGFVLEQIASQPWWLRASPRGTASCLPADGAGASLRDAALVGPALPLVSVEFAGWSASRIPEESLYSTYRGLVNPELGEQGGRGRGAARC